MTAQTEKIVEVVCLGGGPAGLTAAYWLSQRNVSCVVLEQDPFHVGGIAKTLNYKGYRIDIGGHRFFSKSDLVERLWTEILPDDMLTRKRSSRIFFRGRFFQYPLNPLEAFLKLGPVSSLSCVASFLKAKVFPHKSPTNFESWMQNQFGSRLYEIFFKTYTEKVWGIPCSDISSDWAAQRIGKLTLWSAFQDWVTSRFGGRNRKTVIKTLIKEFRYPRLGPGMLWEAAAKKISKSGGKVFLGCRVEKVLREADGTYTIHYKKAGGLSGTVRARSVISSVPLSRLAQMVTPPLGPQARESSRRLKYRDFICVALIVKERNVFDDNWIYIHDAKFRVGRIQNFKSWSPDMVPDAKTNCFGLEYFCTQGDALWELTDEQLVALAKEELVKLGLSESKDILDGYAIRQPKAYPVYDEGYWTHVEVIASDLKHNHPQVFPVGRNGMHKYNNQDHSMLTAIFAAENILRKVSKYDVWNVNQDAQYHESKALSQQIEEPMVPCPARRPKVPSSYPAGWTTG